MTVPEELIGNAPANLNDEESDGANNANLVPQPVTVSAANNLHRYDHNRFFTQGYVESTPILGGTTCGIPLYCLVTSNLAPKIGALAYSCGGLVCLVGTVAGAWVLTIPAEIEANYQNRPMVMEENDGAEEEEQRPGISSRLLRR